MADKQLKRRLYFLCYWCFYTQYGNEKGKVNTIFYFIVRFTKQTWLKYAYLHRKFDFRLAKIRFSFAVLDTGLTKDELVKQEAILNFTDGKWASFLCILALSSVLCRNIYSYYPDCGELRYKLPNLSIAKLNTVNDRVAGVTKKGRPRPDHAQHWPRPSAKINLTHVRKFLDPPLHKNSHLEYTRDSNYHFLPHAHIVTMGIHLTWLKQDLSSKEHAWYSMDENTINRHNDIPPVFLRLKHSADRNKRNRRPPKLSFSFL